MQPQFVQIGARGINLAHVTHWQDWPADDAMQEPQELHVFLAHDEQQLLPLILRYEERTALLVYLRANSADVLAWWQEREDEARLQREGKRRHADSYDGKCALCFTGQRCHRQVGEEYPL